VYVIGQDGTGTLRLLFPTSRSDLRNPLSAGAIHTLPGVDGAGRILRFKAEAQAGTETLFLVARETRIEELEALALAQDQPRQELSANLRNALFRGLGVGAREFRAEADGRKFLADLVDALTRARESGAEGPWLLTWSFRSS
jgi:hypothetical protein